MRRVQKNSEEHAFARFMLMFSDFPEGVIVSTERPDFLVNTSHTIIGVELTDLHRYCPPGVISSQAVQAMRERVIARASEFYIGRGGPPVYCTVQMCDLYLKMKEVDQLATAIAAIIEGNLPGPNSSCSMESEDHPGWPEQLSSVDIHRREGIDETFLNGPGTTWLPCLLPADIQRALDLKEGQYATYRKQCDKAWLLINTGSELVSTWFDLNTIAATPPFITSFDRVFLMNHLGRKLYDLPLS